MENYQTEALFTMAGHKTYQEHLSHAHLVCMMEDFQGLASEAELVKKQLSYGKNLPRELPIDPLTLTQDESDILHAHLGIIGEAGEVIEAKGREAVKNEVGDLLWYIALLLKKYDLDFPEVMQGNVDKLRARYATGKFTREEALNRADMA